MVVTLCRITYKHLLLGEESEDQCGMWHSEESTCAWFVCCAMVYNRYKYNYRRARGNSLGPPPPRVA